MKTLLAGTFDVIHKGHQALIDKTIELAEVYGGQLIITLTLDIMTSRKSHSVTPYSIRRQRLADYIEAQDFEGELHIIPLEREVLDRDMIEELFDDEKVTIIVSEESYPSALEVNKLFKSMGLESMTVVVVPMVLAEDGKRISSTRIRNEEITLEGGVLR